MPALLEHANITVSDASRTADWMSKLFDWKIRWQGPSKDGGHSIHIGTENQYIALYQPAEGTQAAQSSYHTRGGLNHMAVVVEDIDKAEKDVKSAGFVPENHADYEPGKRFYFHDSDAIEYEVVQYD